MIKKNRLLIILLFLVCSVYGQTKKKKDTSKTEFNLPELIIAKCDCSDRVLSTDSVYSFLRSEAFEKYANPYDENLIFSKEPISFEEITGNYCLNLQQRRVPLDLFFFLKKIANIKIHEPNSTLDLSAKKKLEHIDLESVTEVFSAIWDSTTTYSEEIEEWNMYNIRDDWFTKKQHEKVVTLISSLPPGFQVEQERKFRFAQISRPVFNHDYSYALVVFIFMDKHYMPALFRREADGWKEVELNTI